MRALLLAMGVAGTAAVLTPPLSAAPAPDGAPARAGFVIAANEIAAALPFLDPPQPGRERAQPTPVPPSDIDLTIQSPRRTPVPRAAEDLVFYAKDVAIDGVRAYAPDQLRPLIADLIGRKIHLAELLAAAEKIEAQYHEDGFILVRAVVPTQSVGDGMFHIAVIEGFVAALSVDGDDPSTNSRVESLLAPVLASKPLRLPVLEAALLAANEIPGANVTGLLRPSTTEAGASDLIVTARSNPMATSITADNRGGQSTGRWTVGANLAAPSPLGDGGQIVLGASMSPDFNQRHALQAKYVNALADTGATFSVSGLASHGEPAGSVAALKLVSDSYSGGGHLSYPLLLERQQKVTIDGGFTAQSANVMTLGAPFHHDEWRVADAALTWQGTKVLAGMADLSLNFARGLPVLGASPSGGLQLSRGNGQPDFTKVSGTAHTVQRLEGPLSLSAQLQGQHSYSVLLTGEEISFGGAQIGRGYEPAAVTGDDGLGGGVELRYDVDASDLYATGTQFYGFYDRGAIWMHGHTSGANHVDSLGIGVRTTLFDQFSAGVELAHTLTPVPASDLGQRTTRVLFNFAAGF